MFIRQVKMILLASLLLVTSHALTVQAADVKATAPACEVSFKSEDLSSNRYSALTPGTLQAVVWYDGAVDQNNPPILQIQYTDGLATDWITIGGPKDPGGTIEKFDTQVETREYNLGKCELTGVIKVDGVTPDGMVDGMAFGLYVKDIQGHYRLLQSHSHDYNVTSDYVGAWPLGFNDATFMTRTPQITDGIARGQAKMTIISAKYLEPGLYDFGQITIW